VSMPHSNDGVIHLTNPMPSQSFVSEVKIFVMWKNWLLNPIYCILIVPFFFYSQCHRLKLMETNIKP
jgi:hypothetical protein